MKKLSQLFLKGLLAIFPIVITLSVLYWAASLAESTLGSLIQWLLPDNWYWPGMGLLAGFFFVLCVGILLNAYIFRWLGGVMERLVNTIPLVKVIYNGVRDIAKFASTPKGDSDLQKAVVVTFAGDIRVIGFVTRKAMTLGTGDNLVAVYLPMSYQIGGFTVMLPESRIEVLDMDVRDAMRLVLTAAMASPEDNHRPSKNG